MAPSDDEDDYMKMVFDDAPKEPQYETSLQRAARKRREGEARAFQKTKAEREAEAEAAREEALATALPETNKGFRMMAKMGFKRGDALGKSDDARKEPIQVSVKEDRGGIGLESEKKRKFREQWDAAARLAKKAKEEEGDFLEERRQEQKERKLERELNSAQRTAERLSERDAEDGGASDEKERPWKHVNLLWRSRARRRAEKERDKQNQRELNNSLASRLPSFVDEDQDNDSRIAFGQDPKPFYTTLENVVEDEDPELAEFEALPVSEQLQKVLIFLRETWYYCYYCGHQYSNDKMDGCPGVTEDDHD